MQRAQLISPLPPLPWTQQQAALIWGCSYTTVRKLVLQGRVRAEKLGRAWMILQVDRPPAVEYGSLTEAQRAGWDTGRGRASKPAPKRK